MSFSSQIKDEACRITLGQKCCASAELFGLSFGLEKFEVDNISITTMNSALVRRIIRLLKRIDKKNVALKESKRVGKNFSYSIGFDEDNNGNVFKICKCLDFDFAKEYVKDLGDCCRRSVIRGFFLAGGYVSDPEKDYSAQIKFINANAMELASEIFMLLDLKVGKIFREQRHLIYIKEAEVIVTLLSIIGAYNALMEIENVRILKEVKNNVNRAVNCENANLEKIVNTSLKQIADIRLIQSTIGLNKLEERLKIIALARLENKEVSLKELGEIMEPSLGKSGVNHRLKRIRQIAEEIRRGRGDLK